MIKKRKKKRKDRCIFGECTSDIRIISSGETIEEAISNSFFCFKEYVFSDKIEENVDNYENFSFNIEYTDLHDMVHDIYSELIYFIYVKNILISSIDIYKLNKNIMTIKCKCLNKKRPSYYIDREIKAVTYHNLEIKEESGIYKLDITFDV